jgi:hypothetical protein
MEFFKSLENGSFHYSFTYIMLLITIAISGALSRRKLSVNLATVCTTIYSIQLSRVASTCLNIGNGHSLFYSTEKTMGTKRKLTASA